MIDRASRGEVIIAERYGRTLGALVNYAAVAYLAICDDPLFVEALENDDRKAAVQALLDLPEGAVKNAVHKHLLPTVRSDVAATMGSDFQEKFGL